MPDQPTIFAIGGGGFDPDSKHGDKLDRFFLSLTGKSRPKICHIPTASGDSFLSVGRFLKSCTKYDCQPTSLELYRPPSADLVGFLMDQDAVFVGGGSTRNLLVLWREWGLDQALHHAWQNKVLIGGVSAGANCWFEDCSTDSNFGALALLPALGWLPGTCVPHFDEEPGRKPHAESLLKSGQSKSILAIDGGVGVLFHGTTPVRAYGTLSTTSAYHLTPDSIHQLPRQTLD